MENDLLERPQRDLISKEVPPPIPLPRPKVNPPLNFAGFWIRTGAFVLDSIFICIVFTILIYACLLGYVFGAGAHLSLSGLLTLFSAHMNIFNSIAFVINLIYFPVFLSYNGQTPGKMICRLKVTRIDGGSLSFLQALWRTFGYYLNQLTLFIGFLWVAVDNRKQGFHDKIAGTVEIRII